MVVYEYTKAQTFNFELENNKHEIIMRSTYFETGKEAHTEMLKAYRLIRGAIPK